MLDQAQYSSSCVAGHAAKKSCNRPRMENVIQQSNPQSASLNESFVTLEARLH